MADIGLPICGHNGGEGFVCPMAGFWKFCSVKMNNSPFCLMAGLLKVLMTDLLCPLLLGPH